MVNKDEAAPSPSVAQPVAVKPLVWENIDNLSMWANVPRFWMQYRITLRSDGQKALRLEWRDNRGDDLGPFRDWDAAKAFAQTDLSARLATVADVTSPPPDGSRLSMWADVAKDDYTGELVWHCTEEGSKEDGHDEETVTLAANTFAIGTILQIWEPDND